MQSRRASVEREAAAGYPGIVPLSGAVPAALGPVAKRTGLAALALILQHAGPVTAESPPAVAPAGSVVLLWSESGCAPGVSIANGSFLISASGCDRVCPRSDCDGVRVYLPGKDTSEGMLRLADSTVRIERRVESLDAASLRIASPDLTQIRPTAVSAPAPGRVVTVFGFPECDARTEHRGVVTEDGVLEIRTTVASNLLRGGEIVLDENGALLGMIVAGPLSLPDRVSPGDGLQFVQRLLGSLPFQSRATRATALRAVFGGEETSSLIAEIALWNHEYVEHVAHGTPAQRLAAALRFRTGVARVAARSRELGGTDPVHTLLAASQRLGASFVEQARAGPGELSKQAEQLALSSTLATRGLLAGWGGRADLDRLLAAISNSDRDADRKAALKELLTDFRETNPFGPAGPLAALLAALAGAGLWLIAVWAASLGYVLRAAPGGLMARIVTTLVVGLCAWPLSFLVFLALPGNRRGRERDGGGPLSSDGWTL